MSHMWLSHVTHMNESCHTYEWVMSHIWMSPVTHTNESCHTYEWVMSHIWMSHVTHTNESCHTHEGVTPHLTESKQTAPPHPTNTYKWVIMTPHTRTSHVTRKNESRHTRRIPNKRHLPHPRTAPILRHKSRSPKQMIQRVNLWSSREQVLYFFWGAGWGTWRGSDYYDKWYTVVSAVVNRVSFAWFFEFCQTCWHGCIAIFGGGGRPPRESVWCSNCE